MHTSSKEMWTTSLLSSALLVAFVLPWVLFSQSTLPSSDVDNIPPSSAYDTLGPEKDRIVLDLEDGTSPDHVEDDIGLNIEGPSTYNGASIYQATVPEGGLSNRYDSVLSHPSVEHVEEDRLFSIQSEKKSRSVTDQRPDDPLYPFQWNLDQIQIEDSWNLSRGEEVIVSVLDTGVTYKNTDKVTPPRDLEQTRFTSGYDFVENNRSVVDRHGHGTHVTGTIAQSTHNNYGVAGVAYGSTIMPVKVLNKDGFGSLRDIAKGVYYATDEGADVINMSLGSTKSSDILKDAVSYARHHGVTVVAAAGNSGRREPSYPAAYDSTLAVAATQYDKSTTFYSQKGDFVDIAAPGGNNKVDQNDDGKPDGILQETVEEGDPNEHQFALFMGTSMAAPHVAGVAAYLHAWGINHPEKVKSYLKRTALMPDIEDDQKKTDKREAYGSGIIQAHDALKSAQFRSSVYRLLFTLVCALSLFYASRRESILGASARKTLLYVGSALFVAVGGSLLFYLPLRLDIWIPAWAKMLLLPLPEWDVLIGVWMHQNPLSISFLWPLVLISLFHGHEKTWKYVACGCAVGLGAFNIMELVFGFSDVAYIPGVGLWDKLYLALNSVVCFGMAYLSITETFLKHTFSEDSDD
jgi:serine protease